MTGQKGCRGNRVFFFFCLLKSARKKKCEGKKKGKNDRESVWDREGKLGAGSENEICRILKKCDEGWVWKPLRQPECHRLLLRALVGNHLTSQFGLPHIRKSKCGGGQKGQGVVRMVWSPSLCSGEEESGERGRGERTWVSSFILSYLEECSSLFLFVNLSPRCCCCPCPAAASFRSTSPGPRCCGWRHQNLNGDKREWWEGSVQHPDTNYWTFVTKEI